MADMHSHVQQLLQKTQSTFTLEDKLIARALTHKSAIKKGRFNNNDNDDEPTITNTTDKADNDVGHNEKLAFVGRRVLRLHLATYLSKVLQHDSYALATYLSDASLARLLDTRELGANVGRVWQLEKVLKWREVRGPNGEMTGLYKSRGTAVEALVGLVFSQQGIEASSRLFDQLVLPNLSFTSGFKRALESSGSVIETPGSQQPDQALA
ncbi:hypothetical protein OIO90_005204 [Microbotryomycetes sp. JL221]|nr:hypothetical protein OIO90_005204 [Microbotryomycetes sp. JL221]